MSQLRRRNGGKVLNYTHKTRDRITKSQPQGKSSSQPRSSLHPVSSAVRDIQIDPEFMDFLDKKKMSGLIDDDISQGRESLRQKRFAKEAAEAIELESAQRAEEWRTLKKILFIIMRK